MNSIYNGVKQVSDTLFRPGGQAFRKALLVQWPQAGQWTIAFLTGRPGGDVANHLEGDYLSVYVPTTPNPTGGYFVMLRREDVVELDMSVDEALKYIISMGVARRPRRCARRHRRRCRHRRSRSPPGAAGRPFPFLPFTFPQRMRTHYCGQVTASPSAGSSRSAAGRIAAAIMAA